MHISLTPQLQTYIEGKVSGGLYNNASEVVRDALRRMVEVEERHAPDLLRYELRQGLDSLARGESAPYDLAEIMQDVRKKHDQNAPVNPHVIP
jgi:antitoxin ParD1/3/4